MARIEGGCPQPGSVHSSKTRTVRAHGCTRGDHPGALAVFTADHLILRQVRKGGATPPKAHRYSSRFGCSLHLLPVFPPDDAGIRGPFQVNVTSPSPRLALYCTIGEKLFSPQRGNGAPSLPPSLLPGSGKRRIGAWIADLLSRMAVQNFYPILTTRNPLCQGRWLCLCSITSVLPGWRRQRRNGAHRWWHQGQA